MPSWMRRGVKHQALCAHQDTTPAQLPTRQVSQRDSVVCFFDILARRGNASVRCQCVPAFPRAVLSVLYLFVVSRAEYSSAEDPAEKMRFLVMFLMLHSGIAVPFALFFPAADCTISSPTTYNCSGTAPSGAMTTRISDAGALSFKHDVLGGSSTCHWEVSGTFDEAGGTGIEAGTLAFGDKSSVLIFSGFAVRTFRDHGMETLSAWMNITSGTGVLAGAVGAASHACLESLRPTQCIVSGFVEFPARHKV
jgi:hypothetical protein